MPDPLPRFSVFFQDEAPKIGSGWRRIEAKVGWKWVHIRNPSTGARQRIKRAIWDTLKAVPLT